jgi:hypothetical protein
MRRLVGPAARDNGWSGGAAARSRDGLLALGPRTRRVARPALAARRPRPRHRSLHPGRRRPRPRRQADVLALGSRRAPDGARADERRLPALPQVRADARAHRARVRGPRRALRVRQREPARRRAARCGSRSRRRTSTASTSSIPNSNSPIRSVPRRRPRCSSSTRATHSATAARSATSTASTSRCPSRATRFLEDALDALLAEEEPTIQATSAPGCRIEPEPGSADERSGTERSHLRPRRVAHRAEQLRRVSPAGRRRAVRARQLRAGREARRDDPRRHPRGRHAARGSPPADDGPGENAPSPWANDRSLSADELATLEAWVENGKPRGDDADLPLPRPAPHGEWAIGEPDAVFALPEAIAIPADGVLPYRHVAVPTDLTSDRWVQAMQILPGDRSVVHHVLVFALPKARCATDACVRVLRSTRRAGSSPHTCRATTRSSTPTGSRRSCLRTACSCSSSTTRRTAPRRPTARGSASCSPMRRPGTSSRPRASRTTASRSRQGRRVTRRPPR